MTHDLLQTTFPASLDAIHAMVTAQGNWEGELRHVTRDGAAIVVASRWSLQRDQEGNPIALMEINRDITDASGPRRRCGRRRRSWRTSPRVTTLGEVTASFAHEVNQPLAAIVNNAFACLGLLPRGVPSSTRCARRWPTSSRDAERASAIIERVRALDGVGVGEGPIRLEVSSQTWSR